jgi:hypothetical protein
MTEAILLGNVAIRAPGEKLEWNFEKKSFRAKTFADSFLRRAYREGW